MRFIATRVHPAHHTTTKAIHQRSSEYRLSDYAIYFSYLLSPFIFFTQEFQIQLNFRLSLTLTRFTLSFFLLFFCFVLMLLFYLICFFLFCCSFNQLGILLAVFTVRLSSSVSLRLLAASFQCNKFFFAILIPICFFFNLSHSSSLLQL